MDIYSLIYVSVYVHVYIYLEDCLCMYFLGEIFTVVTMVDSGISI